MKRTILFAAFAAVFALVSCVKETPATNGNPNPDGNQEVVPATGDLIPYTFTADTPTKTSIDGDGKITWISTDAIEVYYAGGHSTSSAIELKSGGASASFTVNLPGNLDPSTPLYAVYPATAGASLSGTTLSVTVPAEPASTAFKDADIIVASTTVEAGTFAFKQVLRFVKFEVSAGNPKSITRAFFKDLTGETAIAGTLPVTFDASGNATAGTATSTAAEITASGVQAGDNYIALLPGGDLESVAVKLGTASAWLTPLASDTDLSLETGHIKPLAGVALDTAVGDAYYIKSDGTGNGTSWDNAGGASLLGDLLNTGSDEWKATRAAFKLNGYEIRLAEGTYELDASIAPASSVSFAVKGGYASDGSVDAAKLAALTGNDTHRILWISDNQNANVTFANILFTHGKASDHGGALKILGGSQVFDHCTFTRNEIDGGSKGGGAIYMNPGTSNTAKTLLIQNCVFGGEGTASEVRNMGNDYGSAISLYNCVATVKNTKFLNNSFPNSKQYSDKLNGAAVYIGDRMEASFEDCDFKWNYGGAFRLSGTTALDGRKVSLNNCFFWKNTCNYWGGAIHADSPIPLFINKCKFNGNKGNGHGGHISQNGSNSFVGINNCAFYKGANTMSNNSNAGDVWLDGVSVLANSTLVGPGSVIVLRYSDYFNGSVMVNNVVYPENSGSGYWGAPRFSSSNEDDRVYGYYNLMRGTAGTTALYSGTGDKQTGSSYATFSSIGGTGVESSVTLDYTYTDGVPNPSLTDVENAISFSSGTTSRGANFEAFVTWLNTVGGLSSDLYGNTRTDANNRPGAMVH